MALYRKHQAAHDAVVDRGVSLHLPLQALCHSTHHQHRPSHVIWRRKRVTAHSPYAVSKDLCFEARDLRKSPHLRKQTERLMVPQGVSVVHHRTILGGNAAVGGDLQKLPAAEGRQSRRDVRQPHLNENHSHQSTDIINLSSITLAPVFLNIANCRADYNNHTVACAPFTTTELFGYTPQRPSARAVGAAATAAC
eukprot:6955533-Pyramimonas_sp.AAC.2